jgi:hypothetical protein
MDGLHSTDHSGPSNGPGPSSDHINVDATGSPLPVGDTQPWHFFPLPITPSAPTNRIRFIKAGTYPYFCFVHQDVMRGTIIVNKADVVAFNTPTGSPGGTTNVGQTVTFTVTLTSPLTGGAPAAVGPPTGTVSIIIDGTATVLGSASLVPVGNNLQSTATIQVTALPGGTTNVRAVYNGDTNFNGRNGNNAVSRTVNKATPTVTLTNPTNPSTFGQQVTFTATVSGSGATPTGTVTFKDNGVAISGAVSLSSGQATFQISSLSVGSGHTITVDYSGDASYNAVNATAMTGNPQVVNKATPTVSVSSSAPTGVFVTQTVTFTAAVSGPITNPTGSVTFLDNGTPIPGTAALVSGVASKDVVFATGGNRTITASYGGDSNFNTATGSLNTNPQPVRDFSVSATPNPLSGTSGQTRTFNGTVTSLGGYGPRTVGITCGAGAPATCTPNPSSVSVPAGGNANFTVDVSSASPAGTNFNFNIVGRDTVSPFSVGSPLQRQQAVTYSVVATQVDMRLMQLDHSATPDPVQRGEMVQLQSTVKNVTGCSPGPCPGHSVVVTFTFSTPLTGITATPSVGTCSQGTAPITCSLNDIADGVSRTIALTFVAPSVRTLTTTAVVSSNDSDTNIGDNTGNDPMQIRHRQQTLKPAKQP